MKITAIEPIPVNVPLKTGMAPTSESILDSYRYREPIHEPVPDRG
jgi:hypothetical protein